MKEERLYLQRSLDEYLKELSAREIIPGGGSAAALTAALGAGLNLMVINYSAQSEDIASASKKQHQILDQLRVLIDGDCKAFGELMEAVSSGRNAQEEYRRAAAVPMDICRHSHTSMGITFFLLQNGNKKLITDVGCAASTLKGAFASAELNAEINLSQINDVAFVKNAREEISKMKKDLCALFSKIDEGVRDIMKKRGPK